MEPGADGPGDGGAPRQSALVLDGYEAVVYDLDGTLVHLAVDWAAVERDLVDLLDGVDVETDGLDTWAMYDAAREADDGVDAILVAVERVLSRHEVAGASDSTRLPLADSLDHGLPIGVCSLNCEAACHEALASHGLDTRVEADAVVGRDTVPARKPDPTPLLAAIEALGATPGTTLFVGDSPGDEEAARRAGVDFAAVEPPWDEEPEGPIRDAERG